jgi:hypothetical protein
MNLRVRMWIFPMFRDPFPYEIVEPDGTQYLPALPVEDDLVDDEHKAARMLDLSFMIKYIGQPIDVYIQGIKQTDSKLTKVARIDGLWSFDTE